MGKKQRIRKACSMNIMKQLDPPITDNTRSGSTHSKLKYINNCIKVLRCLPLFWFDAINKDLKLCIKLGFLKYHNSDIKDFDLFDELLFLQINGLTMRLWERKDIIIVIFQRGKWNYFPWEELKGISTWERKDIIMMVLQNGMSNYFPWEELKGINTWRSTHKSSNGHRNLILSIPCQKFLLVDLFYLLFRLAFGLCYFMSMMEKCMMEKCEEMIPKALSNKIQRNELERGDHIYTWRGAHIYAHHGIYVGRGMVIHLTRGPGHFLSSSSRSHPSDNPRGHRSTYDRVIASSLDSFLYGGDLCRFEYGVCLAFFLASRGGTCTLAPSDPPDVVVYRANTLRNKGFGTYNLSENNCEDFAMYCKTGLIVEDSNCVRRSIGRSGQAASWLATIVVIISSLLRRSVASFTCLVFMGFFIHSIFRWVSDIGVRRNVRKVEVEELSATFKRFGLFCFRCRTLLDNFRSYLVRMMCLFLCILLCKICWPDVIILYAVFV